MKIVNLMRLVGLVLAATLLSVGLTGYFTARTLNTNQAQTQLLATALQNHMEADMLHDSLRGTVYAATYAGKAGDAKLAVQSAEDIAEQSAKFKAAIDANGKLPLSNATHATLAAVRAPLEQYIASAQNIVAQTRIDNTRSEALLPEFNQHFRSLETAMANASTSLEDEITAEVTLSQDTATFSNRAIPLALAFGLMVVAAIIVWLQRGVVTPLRHLTNVLADLTAGKLDVIVPAQETKNEIGDIARAVEFFRQSAMEKVRFEAETASERERSTAERERVAARQNLVVERLAEALGALSQGDLTHALPADFPEEYVRLRDDHAAAIGRLRETMQAIVQSAETIRTGTGEIAGASEDLARRTEAQAASLEQTAAALEETSGAVKTTATNSRDAASKVAGAKETAAESGTVAQQTIDAIARIQASQREIGSIVGVMQEIAYQTNILALNAGVEAARAGDAGRGFMVVANEVRLLAQRSSEAAKDIQRLIGSSNEQVDGGVTLVNRSADMLKRIVDDVMSVNELIADIASASERQAMGVNQISSAVNQMDSTTQQNAAMVEQTTAAARSLASETEALTAQIGFFRIGRTAQAYTPAAETRPARTQLRLASGGDFTPTTSNEDWNRF